MRALIITCRILVPIVAVWGIHGFGGGTLVELLKQRLSLSARVAELLVSGLVAVLGTVALLSSGRKRAR